MNEDDIDAVKAWMDDLFSHQQPAEGTWGYHFKQVVEKTDNEAAIHYEKARYLEAVLSQIIDGARFNHREQAWIVKFKGKYLNDLRKALGMGEVGQQEDDHPVLTMWPEKQDE